MPSFLLWLIITFLFLVGLVGVVIPAVPGIGFIFAGILLYALVTGFTDISVTTVLIFGAVTVFVWLIDYAGAALGTYWSGGRSWALVGTIVGSLAGFFIVGPVGLLLGSFVGALIGALYDGHGPERALRVAVISVVGALGATLVQFLFGLGMIVAFLILVFA